jgi:hypothetical protein
VVSHVVERLDAAMGGARARRLGLDVSAVAVLTVVAAVTRFPGLGHQSYWYDETVTVQLLSKPFTGMVSALPHSESAPPLYYIAAWFWSRIFGSGETALRSLSALAGTVTIPVAYASGKALVSRRTGLAVAALGAVSPLLVWYSQEARAYALFVLLGALSLLAFAHALDRPSVKTLTWWAALTSLALLTHYFAVFLAAGEATVLLCRHLRRATVVATAAIVAVGLALLPLADFQANHAASSWIRSVDLRLRLEETAGQLLIPNVPSIWGGAGVPESAGRWWPLGVVLLVAGSAVALWLGHGRRRRGVLVALVVGVVAAGVPAILAVLDQLVGIKHGDVFLFRNVIVAWLPLTMVIAAGLTAPRAGRIGMVAFAGLWSASLAVLLVNTTTAHLQRDDWRLVAAAIRGPAHAIIVSPGWEGDALLYYEPMAGMSTARSIGEIDVVLRRWNPALPKTVHGFDPPSGFRKVGTRQLQNWDVVVFRAPAPVSIGPQQLDGVHPPDASRILLVSSDG